jgi:antitoxin YefM
MKTLPLSEAKSQLSGLVEQVRALDDQVTITRNGRPVAVLVSAEEFERWKETIEVRGDAALMKEIRAGLRSLRSRKARLYTLEELLA